METKLEMLLMSKSFGDLNPEERGYVLSLLTEEAYKSYHTILNYSDDVEKNLVPRRETIKNLATAFNTSKPKMTAAQVIGVAACVALAIGFILFIKIDKQKPEIDSSRILASKPMVKDNSITEKEVIDSDTLEQRSAPVRIAKSRKALKKIKSSKLKDTVIKVDGKLYGLWVDQPLLGLNVDAEEPLLGLYL